MTSSGQADPTLAELLTLWPRLTDEARQSLLRIARAKAGARTISSGEVA